MTTTLKRSEADMPLRPPSLGDRALPVTEGEGPAAAPRQRTRSRRNNAVSARGPHRGPDTKKAPLGAIELETNYLNLFGSPGWIRTSDHSINSRMLYR